MSQLHKGKEGKGPAHALFMTQHFKLQVSSIPILTQVKPVERHARCRGCSDRTYSDLTVLQASVAINNDNKQNGLPFIAGAGLGYSQYINRTFLRARHDSTAQWIPAPINVPMSAEQLHRAALEALTSTDYEGLDEA